MMMDIVALLDIRNKIGGCVIEYYFRWLRTFRALHILTGGSDLIIGPLNN